MKRILVLGILALAVAACAGGGATPTSEPTATPSFEPGTRLAAHLFVPAGETRSLAGLGELLEIVPFQGQGVVTVEGDTLTANHGGTACLRLRYREPIGYENEVQSLCVVVVDEIGECDGLTPVAVDLNRSLDPAVTKRGNANLLESGDGLFYSVCETAGGTVRLQRSGQDLPAPYFHIVDALADGPYSLGLRELAWQRAGVLTTFSGEEISPAWIVTVSQEVSGLAITEDLRVTYAFDDCAESPACGISGEYIELGDHVRVGAGINAEELDALRDGIAPGLLDRYYQDRIGVSLDDLAGIFPDAERHAFRRLVALDVMRQALAYFDDLYSLTAKGIDVGWWQPWMAATPITYPFACAPGEEEGALCERLETAVQAAEARVIQGFKDAGVTMWQAGLLDYGPDGAYTSWKDFRPVLANFDGFSASVAGNSSHQVPDVAGAVAAAVRGWAEDIGPGMPMVLLMGGPPIEAQTGGGACEGDICLSDFDGAYAIAEAALAAGLDAIAPADFRGFGLALYEGSHFDVMDPFEMFDLFPLNRVGETGYNHPVTNIWLTR